MRQTIHCKPEACRRCGQGLRATTRAVDPSGGRIAQDRALVDEYRLHRLTCPGCGETTCAPAPGVPSGCFGPYLQAVLAMLAGAYRLSKRQIQQVSSDLFTLSISTGMIAKLERQSAAALEAPYNELALSVHQAEVANIDETSWREQLRKVWLWVTVTRLTTVFTIAKNRSGAIARALLGSQDGQVVTSDRFSAYDWIMASWRQICWAHTIRTQSTIRPALRRDFRSIPLHHDSAPSVHPGPGVMPPLRNGPGESRAGSPASLPRL
ncbi:transposase [Singulisphaera sp. Ch08]|uniref:Transposase n=1 Tax=Singulisphaera sp. Ch08 TaxID=3120278 RepID=A0AAU7C9X9_9BACT